MTELHVDGKIKWDIMHQMFNSSNQFYCLKIEIMNP